MNNEQLKEMQDAIVDIFDAEPAEVQEAIAETVVPPALLTIIKKHNIPLNKSEGFKNYIYMVLLNIENMDSVGEWLTKQCRIPEEDVEATVSDIERMVLNPIQKIRTQLISRDLSVAKKEEGDQDMQSIGKDDGYRETIEQV